MIGFLHEDAVLRVFFLLFLLDKTLPHIARPDNTLLQASNASPAK